MGVACSPRDEPLITGRRGVVQSREKMETAVITKTKENADPREKKDREVG